MCSCNLFDVTNPLSCISGRKGPSTLSSTTTPEAESSTETNKNSIESLSDEKPTRKELLDKALSRSTSSSAAAAAALLDELSSLRNQDGSKVEELLQELLALIPQSNSDETTTSTLPW